jgi:hypothetical protein
VSIVIESVDTVWYDLSGSLVFPRVTATVRITNEGGGIVDNVVVNHWLPYAGICSMVGKTLHLEDLNLAPGASTTAQMDSLWLNYAPWGIVNLDQQFCIAALSPNALYDRDGSDNLACDTAHIVLGLEELTAAPPFALVQQENALELRFNAPTATELRLGLLDASGRIHAEAFIPRGVTVHRIGTTGLASGLHVVRVCDAGRGCWAVKWVKE